MNNSSNPFESDNHQMFQSTNQNLNTSLELYKLDISEPVNLFACRIQTIFDKIEEHKSIFENNKIKSDNEANCLKLCEHILQEHIKSLDQLDISLKQRNNLSDKLEEANYKIKDLERSLRLEKDLKNDLRKKFEEDEQQNQDENLKKEKLIKELQFKLKKLENEKKQLNDEKQDLLFQYQIDLSKCEKERVQLQIANKKLINDKDLDELQSLNNKNTLFNLTHELCTLFNLASANRKSTAFFGRQFLDAFDLVFGRFKLNMSNVTFLDMSSISEDLNSSILNLRDITCDELNNFNIILKEKLIQNKEFAFEDRIRNNSKLIFSDNLENSFENRLLGNETFKMNSLHETINNTQSDVVPILLFEIIAQDIIDELIDAETKRSIIKSMLEIQKSNNSILGNSICKDQIKFMFKSDGSMINESFEEIYNRFEESFTENLAKNCGSVIVGEQELLKNILENVNLTSKRVVDNDVNKGEIKKVNQTKSISSNSNCDKTERNLKIYERNNSEIQSIVKSKNWIDSTNSSRSRTSSNNTANTTKDLMITLNPTNRSDGESQTDTSSCCTEMNTDSDANSMHMTNFNNLSNVFNELSNDQKLNSTVKTTENNGLNSIYSNNNCANSTLSSDMRLSEDHLKEADYLEDLNNQNNESDPIVIDAMMSKDRSCNFEDFYSTIKKDSNYSITNMDLTNPLKSKSSSLKSSSTGSNQTMSLSKLIDKYDEDVLKENSVKCSFHSSNSKCRFRRRKSTWSPYFSPLLSLLYLFYPLFFLFKCIFFVMLFFIFVTLYLLNHLPVIRIYYSSWEDMAMYILNFKSS